MGRVRALQASISETELKSYVGKSFDVLVENQASDNGLQQGYSEHYLKCQFSGPKELSGKLVKVVAKEVKNNKIFCLLTH